MRETELGYFTRRIEKARTRAANAGSDIVRQTHERFAVAYAEHVARTRVPKVDGLLG